MMTRLKSSPVKTKKTPSIRFLVHLADLQSRVSGFSLVTIDFGLRLTAIISTLIELGYDSETTCANSWLRDE